MEQAPFLSAEFRRCTRLVTVQSKSVTRDAYGGEVVTWATFGTAWAAVEPMGGREFVAMQQAQSEASVRVRMPYLSGVLPTMRVLDGSNAYEILSVRNLDSRNEWLELLCRHLVL